MFPKFSGRLGLRVLRMPFLSAWSAKPGDVVEMVLVGVVEDSAVESRRVDALLGPFFFVILLTRIRFSASTVPALADVRYRQRRSRSAASATAGLETSLVPRRRIQGMRRTSTRAWVPAAVEWTAQSPSLVHGSREGKLSYPVRLLCFLSRNPRLLRVRPSQSGSPGG